MKREKQEMKEKAEKPERKEKKFRQKSILPGAILVGFLAAAIIFVVMLNAEKKALSDYERGSVLIALKNVPEGEMITEANWSGYFQLKDIDQTIIPPAALTTPDQVYGMLPIHPLEEGVILTSGMFENIEDVTKGMTQPVVAGLKADDLYQVVGGTLRAGDRIHIYTVNEDTGETVLVWTDVFVQQVFDGSGNVILNEDSLTAAQRMNIFMEEGSIEQFYSQLALGSLRVVKVW